MKSFVLNGIKFTKCSKQSISPLGHPYNLCIEFKPNTFCFGKFSCCDEYVEIEYVRFFSLIRHLEIAYLYLKNQIRIMKLEAMVL